MTFDEWRADFLIMLEYQDETLQIDLELNWRWMFNRGHPKFQDFTKNQLLLVRNNLHGRINQIGKKLNEHSRTLRNSR